MVPQKVIRVGDSAAVIIPKKSLKELGIRMGDEVSVEINQRAKLVSIRPLDKSSRRQKKIATLTYNFINRYRKDLENLAKK